MMGILHFYNHKVELFSALSGRTCNIQIISKSIPQLVSPLKEHALCRVHLEAVCSPMVKFMGCLSTVGFT